MNEEYYNTISNALSTLIDRAQGDGQINLQNKNILMEGFYREFLNILKGWKLINANAEQHNAPGIDLIDRENRIVAQVSATCDHEKIQHSLSEFVPPDEGEWHFYFIPIKKDKYTPREPFIITHSNVTFDPKNDILYGNKLQDWVKDAVSDRQFRLYEFVQLEKVFLWKDLNDRLKTTRDRHPSFALMKLDEDLDKQLYPRIKDTPALLDVRGKNADGEICPIWELIRQSWRLPENHSIVIQGDGGIGKTVALFSIADAENRYCPAPAVYVPMHRLVTQEGQIVKLHDYLHEISDKIDKLAREPWNGGPQLLVLLDGFNEVPTDKQIDIRKMLNEWRANHKGAQFIAVSRPVDMVNLEKELEGEPIAIKLEPLEPEVVRERLAKFGVTPPDDGAAIWDTLRLPLFLTLYIKTDRLAAQTADGYPLAVKPPQNAGALIWNYLQRELLREKLRGESSEAWVMRCAFACEYILPYIAFHMEREHRFTIKREEAKTLIKEALSTINLEKLPRHLTELLNFYDERHGDFPDLSVFNWNNTALKDVGLLKSKDRICEFVHQHFRDALAGLYLVNQAEIMQDGDALPKAWRRAANDEVMRYAADLMEEAEAARLWKANRDARPTDRAATYAMLELQRHRASDGDSTLDFSGMDLRGMSLVRYMREKNAGERDMKLFRRPELSVRTRLNEETFRSPGHTLSVNCVAVTGDGRCVSGSWDDTLRVWDLNSGECLRTLKGHTNSVNCVAVTEDDRCVSGSSDNTLRVWDLNSGECLRTLKGHTDSVRCVAVTGDGRCVSGSNDGTLRVWDLNTGKCLRTLKGYTRSVYSVAVTADGRCVSGSRDNTLRVWDLNTGECLHTLKGHTDWVRCVATIGDGQCVSGSKDNALRVWDIRTGKCLRTLKGHTHWVNCVAVTENGQCVSGAGKTLQVWDLNTGECLRVLEGHTDGVNCVAATEDGQCVSGSWDDTLRVWDLNTGECLRTLKGHAGSVSCVAVTDDGRCISGSNDTTLRVWDLTTGKCLRTLEGHTSWVRCVAITADGKRCVSGSDDRTLRVWDLNSGEYPRTLEGHAGWVNSVAATGDGQCVSGSRDRTLRVWDLYTVKYVRTLGRHVNGVNSVTATGDGRCVSGSWDNTLRVWNLDTGECFRTLKGHAGSVSCVAMTGNGRCVSGSDDKTLQVWNLDTGECLRTLEGHADWVRCVAMAEDGRCISGADDRTLRVWDLNTGECLRVLKGHTGSVRCVAMLDGKKCISGSGDGTLRIWDIDTGECLDRWRSTEVDVAGMDFTEAELASSELARTLWQNRAKVREEDNGELPPSRLRRATSLYEGG